MKIMKVFIKSYEVWQRGASMLGRKYLNVMPLVDMSG